MEGSIHRKSSSILVKSKKIAESTEVLQSSAEETTWSSVTPEKPLRQHTRSRSRNRGVALSVKEVKEIAKRLLDPKKNHSPLTKEIDSKPQIDLARGSDVSGKSKNDSAEKNLPKKYESLCQFFNSLDCSIRLLRMKRSISSFTNICRKVESLTDRRFSYGNLAQLMFIMPEAIKIKKILTFDEETKCMKPDLQVWLNPDAVESDERVHSHVRKTFRSRMIDFYKAHPEIEDIPEETLPYPFNSSKHETKLNCSNDSVSQRSSQEQVTASHVSRSFCQSFSKARSSETSADLETSILPQNEEASAVFPLRSSQQLPLITNPNKTASSASSSTETETPRKQEKLGEYLQIETPKRMTISTPALRTPKRCSISASPEDCSTSSPLKLTRLPPRSLNFDTNVADDHNAVNKDLLDVLPPSLLKSIMEKEKKTLEEKDPAISQAKKKREMIINLPKVFNMILFVFQSLDRSVATKEELVHKILSNSLDVVDRGEIEEQLKLLLALAPDWIHEKVASSGDSLICVNKRCDSDAIRGRLMEAK